MTPDYDEKNFQIAPIENMPWGSHVCQFYLTKDDLLDVLIPYFKEGLEKNELCVWITSDFLTREEAFRIMGESMPNFFIYAAKGNIQVFSYIDWYFSEGHFSQDKALKLCEQKYKEALAKGFSGMRVSGDASWLVNEKDRVEFTQYEAQINNIISDMKIVALCTYSLGQCGSDYIVDVVQNHKCAIIREKGLWQLVFNAGE